MRQNSRRRYRPMSTFLTCPGIDLIYERATVFERGFSLDCIRHHYDSTQRCSWALERMRQRSFFGRAYVSSAERAVVVPPKGQNLTFQPPGSPPFQPWSAPCAASPLIPPVGGQGCPALALRQAVHPARHGTLRP
jgi:hypothetical protein